MSPGERLDGIAPLFKAPGEKSPRALIAIDHLLLNPITIAVPPWRKVHLDGI
jgi:hypothetical protein